MTTNQSPTRNESPQPDISILKSLRALMPTRVLTYAEALSRAELQAARLLELSGLRRYRGPVPTELVTELPRIRVEQGSNMPVSGSAHWDGGTWVLTVNRDEFELRQRFSLFHEFKHIVDHTTRHLIQGDKRLQLSADDMAEKIADYFAACVLMPKAWVKHAYCNQGIQKLDQLADHFQVSPKAMAFRLSQLGLTLPNQRCDTTPTPTRSEVGLQFWPARQAGRSSFRLYNRARSTTVMEGATP